MAPPAQRITVVSIIVIGATMLLFEFGREKFGKSLGPRGLEFERHAIALNSLNEKIRQYVLEHSPNETEGFEQKTISDLVVLGILSPEDEGYVRDRAIRFYGFNTDFDKHIPVFEEDLNTPLNQKRLIIYANGSGMTEDLFTTK
jgi:hypothetical protein